MEAEDAAWVSIGLKGQALGLRATGHPDTAYPGGAYRAALRVDAGDLQLHRICGIYDLPRFCTELEALYESLRGRAELATLDDVNVSLEGDGAGHVSVVIEAGEVAAANYRLHASFGVDQTFLIPFARGLRAAFPDVPR
jgi:hypothetical protein